MASRVHSYITPLVLKPDALRMGITRSAALLNTVWIAWRTPCACIDNSFIAIALYIYRAGDFCAASTLYGHAWPFTWRPAAVTLRFSPSPSVHS